MERLGAQIMGDPVLDVVYLDTLFIGGHYSINQKRIEISEYLKQFKRLHDFILKHEIEHGELHHTKGFTLRHIWIDYRDRFKLFWDPILFEQFRAFQKLREPKNLKQYCYMILYNLAGSFTMFLGLLAFRHRIKGLKTWLKENIHEVLR